MSIYCHLYCRATSKRATSKKGKTAKTRLSGVVKR
jgi:hypothetical protein